MAERGVSNPTDDLAKVVKLAAATIAVAGAAVGWLGHMAFHHLLWEPQRARRA